MADVEFFFDPVCPFCWVTSRWVREVQGQRELDVRWRPIALRILNEHEGAYDDKPDRYPDAHQRGLELLRVVVAAEERHGADVVGPLYEAMGEAIWESKQPAPGGDGFDAVLESVAEGVDIAAVLERQGLDTDLASAAGDDRFDARIRRSTEEGLERAGGDVGTPIISLSPPDGPAFFGPVISDPPTGRDALRYWDALETLAEMEGFAEIKRSLRSMPVTALTAPVANEETRAA